MLTRGQGVDIAFDTVGGTVTQQTFARLRNLRFSQELVFSRMYFGWTDALWHHGWRLEQRGALIDGHAHANTVSPPHHIPH